LREPFSSPFFFLEKKKMVVGETPTTGQKFKEYNSQFKIHNFLSLLNASAENF